MHFGGLIVHHGASGYLRTLGGLFFISDYPTFDTKAETCFFEFAKCPRFEPALTPNIWWRKRTKVIPPNTRVSRWQTSQDCDRILNFFSRV